MATLALTLAAILLPVAGSADLARGENCDETDVELGIVHATGCFTRGFDGNGNEYLQSGIEPLRMNGFTIAEGRQHMRFYTGKNSDPSKEIPMRVTSGEAPITLTSGFVEGTTPELMTWEIAPALDFNPPEKGSMPLTDAAFTGTAKFFNLLAPLNTKGLVALNEEGGHFEVHFEIKSFLQFVEKGGEIALGFEVDEDGKVKFEGFEGEAEGIPIAGLAELEDLSMDLTTQPEFDLHATAGVTLKVPDRIKGKGLKASFGLNSLGPTELGLAGTGLNLQFGTTGVFLQKAGLTLFAQPLGFGGEAAITAGPMIRILNHDLAALEVDGRIDLRAPEPEKNKHGYLSTTAAAKVINLPVASAHFRYDFGVGTDFGASFGLGVPSFTNDPNQPFYMGGDINGWTTAKHFDLEGQSRIRILGWDLAGAKTVLSDRGMAGCVKVLLGWVGGGVTWNDGKVWPMIGTTCDIGWYRSQRSAAVQLSDPARGETMLDLDEDTAVIKVVGEDAPPMVALEHPDGRALQTPPVDDEDGMTVTKHGAAIATHDGGNAVHFIPRDGNGRWVLRNLSEEGVDVKSVSVAGWLPDHNVKARLRGKGLRRTLVWSARKIPHQNLVFTEVLSGGREAPLFRTARARGRRVVRLARGPGNYGRRKLRVDVRQRFDSPRDKLISDRYRVKPPARPGQPKRVRAVRLLHDVVVSWKPAKRASGYRILTSDPTGLRQVRTVGPRARKIRLDSVATMRKLRIAVFATNVDGVEGRPGRTALRTHRLVGGPKRALDDLIEGLRRHAEPGRVVGFPECPRGGSCTFEVEATKGERTIAQDVVRLGPDMTDRIALTDEKLERLGRARLHASLLYKGKRYTRTLDLAVRNGS